MRKFVTLLSLAVAMASANSADAQSFKMQSGDTVYVNTTAGYTSHNNIENMSGANMKLQWKVIYNNMPADWSATLGICDNKQCYSGSDINVGNLWETLDYSHTVVGDFHLTGDLSSASGVGPYVVRIRLNNKTIPTDTAIATFIFGKGTASVPTTKVTAADVQLYPNPATSSVNVVFDEAADVKNVAIYNIIGKQMSLYRTMGNSANMNVENMPAGIYFVRLLNSRGDIVATRKFTKQ